MRWCRYAIAHAVLQHLSSQQDCRQLFATHYHPLTAEFANNRRVALAHMAAVVTQPTSGKPQYALGWSMTSSSRCLRSAFWRSGMHAQSDFSTQQAATVLGSQLSFKHLQLNLQDLLEGMQEVSTLLCCRSSCCFDLRQNSQDMPHCIAPTSTRCSQPTFYLRLFIQAA